MNASLENEYLKIEDKKLMFRIRTSLIDVKADFRTKFKDDLTCHLCNANAYEESQPHLFSCVEI